MLFRSEMSYSEGGLVGNIPHPEEHDGTSEPLSVEPHHPDKPGHAQVPEPKLVYDGHGMSPEMKAAILDKKAKRKFR